MGGEVTAKRRGGVSSLVPKGACRTWYFLPRERKRPRDLLERIGYRSRRSLASLGMRYPLPLRQPRYASLATPASLRQPEPPARPGQPLRRIREVVGRRRDLLGARVELLGRGRDLLRRRRVVFGAGRDLAHSPGDAFDEA